MYIAQAYKGLSENWRYVLGILAVFFCWQILGGIPLIIGLVLKSDSLSVFGSGDLGLMAEVLGTNTFLFLMLLTFAIGLLSLFVYVKFVHKQRYNGVDDLQKKS